MSQPERQARFDAFLQTGKVDQKNNNYNNNLSSNEHNKKPEAPTQKRINYDNYKQLKERIHSEREFLMAQSWGVFDRFLCTLCVEYGYHRVRQSILKVEKIQDRFFREDRPIEPQRGAYVVAVIRRS